MPLAVFLEAVPVGWQATSRSGGTVGVGAGARGVRRGIATILGAIFLVVLAVLLGGCGQATNTGGSGSPAASAPTATPSNTTDSAHHFSFESEQELRVVSSGMQKQSTAAGDSGASGIGKWWHTSYAPRSTQDGVGFRFDVGVLTLPIELSPSGDFGYSYQAKTSLTLELMDPAKKKSTASITKLQQLSLDGSPGWASVVRQTGADGDTLSMVLYAAHKNRMYRLEFTTAVTNAQQLIDLFSAYTSTFRMT